MIDDLFRIIGQLKEHGVGIVYISHKMDELKRISDRVTVMRDGQYINTVPTATTSMDTIISMMVGRPLFEGDGPSEPAADNEIVLEVRNLNRGRAIKDVRLHRAQGRDPRFCRTDGRRAHRGRARDLRWPDKIDSGEILVHGNKVSIQSPADAVKHGIGYLSEDRKHFGLATGMSVASNIVLATMKRFLSFSFVLKQSVIRDSGNSFVKQPRHQDTVAGTESLAALRRQSTEDRHRQVAGARQRNPLLRRTDAWHRRRRQERNLQTAQRLGASRAAPS